MRQRDADFFNDPETDVFTLELPDIHPSRRERIVFWVKAHLYIYKMRTLQKLGRVH